VTTPDFVHHRVKHYYWDRDLNCATTTLKVLAEKFDLALAPQVIAAATGMHGAGEYGAQCGLVEGGLMFMGIVGQARGIPEAQVVDACRRFAGAFDKRFASLLCRQLRPQGFRPENPPHLCEGLTRQAIDFAIAFVETFVPATPARKTGG
jgi:C_GCAxxG_C_C family probable redox protein